MTFRFETRKGKADTSLHRAAAACDLPKVRALLAAGENVNAKNEFGETALHQAIILGKLAAVPLLCAAGSILDASDLINGTTRWRKQ